MVFCNKLPPIPVIIIIIIFYPYFIDIYYSVQRVFIRNLKLYLSAVWEKKNKERKSVRTLWIFEFEFIPREYLNGQ